MSKKIEIKIAEDKLFLIGDLCFTNVMSAYEKSVAYFHTASTWRVDFSKISSSDSAGLALMIEWCKLAKQAKRSLRFLHLSPNLLSIAKAANMQSLFSLE
jgi:phospholipid transport system transporter-binding protein